MHWGIMYKVAFLGREMETRKVGWYGVGVGGEGKGRRTDLGSGVGIRGWMVVGECREVRPRKQKGAGVGDRDE